MYSSTSHAKFKFRYRNRLFSISKPAYTLIELLVVIAIIATIAAIIFPVFGTARGSARRTSCLSNEHQVGMSVAMYVQDYDGYYPFAINPADHAHPELWGKDPVDYDPAFQALIPTLPQLHEVLLPYTRSKEVFHCPSDFGLSVMDPFPGWMLDASPSSYARFGTSYFYHTGLAQKRISESSLQNSSICYILRDANGKWHGSYSEPILAHQTLRYNVLFADIHVKNLNHGTVAMLYNTY